MAIFFLECSPPALSAPKRLFFGFARNGKQGRCAHTCYFAWPVAPQKCLLGAPQTRWTSGHFVQKSLLSAAPALPLLGLIFPPFWIAAQEVDVALDRHSLTHIRLGFAVLGIEGLFFSESSRRRFFSASIFGSFAPSKSSLMAAFAAR